MAMVATDAAMGLLTARMTFLPLPCCGYSTRARAVPRKLRRARCAVGRLADVGSELCWLPDIVGSLPAAAVVVTAPATVEIERNQIPNLTMSCAECRGSGRAARRHRRLDPARR